ncbi:hypothetical protein DFP94_11542 [Fontibacillus phaseoli]|uniref:Uncharacterized protein n=1 Tax=Fontibacillus phaseoli TaxID=1416533 RepID=A0A369B468_9BACL|nr:hypothetical protein [Fontibacillus phaseoli]RCX15358.1 hypothetical protein DFP94_11542 [Fontibacillus phaseoli]
MPTIRRLLTEQDFQEALDRQLRIRVFRNDHMVDNNTLIIRFTDETVITQTGVSELTYHSRRDSQFFELKK